MKAIFRSIFFLPGVIIHELSHHFCCIICSAKVIDVCYYNFKDSSGYVLHEQPKHLYQNVLISTAPFLDVSVPSRLPFPGALPARISPRKPREHGFGIKK